MQNFKDGDKTASIVIAALLALAEKNGGRLEITPAEMTAQIGKGIIISHEPGPVAPWVFAVAPPQDAEPDEAPRFISTGSKLIQ